MDAAVVSICCTNLHLLACFVRRFNSAAAVLAIGVRILTARVPVDTHALPSSPPVTDSIEQFVCLAQDVPAVLDTRRETCAGR